MEEEEDGSDNEDGYRSDNKYSNEEMPFELDNVNLRKVTGRENSISIGEGGDKDHRDENDGVESLSSKEDDGEEESDREDFYNDKVGAGKNREDEGKDKMGAEVNIVTHHRKSQQNRN